MTRHVVKSVKGRNSHNLKNPYTPLERFRFVDGAKIQSCAGSSTTKECGIRLQQSAALSIYEVGNDIPHFKAEGFELRYKCVVNTLLLV